MARSETVRMGCDVDLGGVVLKVRRGLGDVTRDEILDEERTPGASTCRHVTFRRPRYLPR